MSRNNKNARRHAEARERSKQRQAGNKGPSKTQPQHGKRWTYRNNPEIQKRIAEQLKAGAPESSRGKTSGKKILEGAGSAASTADSRD